MSGSAGTDPYDLLRAATRARVALGRAGDGLPTARVLELRAALAAARDALHAPLDEAAVRAALPGREVLAVASAAPDRATYLQRPDLGRLLAPGTSLPPVRADLALVLADGLSPPALAAHGPPLAAALLDRLPGWSVAPLVLARQARVALGDEVGAALRARAVVVLVGERPGLSAADSLGAYLTWDPRPGRRDSERNCVSNVRPPHGLPYDRAADVLAALLQGARALGRSGTDLKDELPELPGWPGSPALGADRVGSGPAQP